MWRWRALLVLGVLAGLLGMHTLGPAGGLMPGAHERPAAMATAMTTAPSAHSGCDGAHIHHADPACASPALGGGPTLSAPPSTPVADCDLAAARSGTAPSPADGRAPPTLAELQLLRI
ncbi:DUF6153 family protein [Streptomyces sp. FXJ1.4098]|nr:DUF6153 family protein [Streptomyces sp. FXJ1.4098]